MKSVFEEMKYKDHEQVVFCNDPDTGLKSIIAIHNTTIGPALGGCRMWNYDSEDDALKDVLRLSRGMSFKAAIAQLNLGGGKAVIFGDSKKDKSEVLFRSFGRFVQGLGGRYITAEDVGTTVHDMEWVRMETQYVTGISRALGGSGDPSPVTAFGTYIGMLATVKKQMGKDSLQGLKVSVQGVGHVGYHLCKYLADAGAEIYATDIDQQSLKKIADKYNSTIVDLDKIYDLDVDIYAPCALGATINDETIPRIKASIIAGAANNQLAEEAKHGQMLKDKGILYAPDYAINAGGLINVANEIDGYNRERAFNQAEGIYETLMTIYETSDAENIPTNHAAEKVAIQRMEEISKLRNVFLPKQNPMSKRDN